jgi:hypothetical protein
LHFDSEEGLFKSVEKCLHFFSAIEKVDATKAIGIQHAEV